jgi:exocyst complex component 1
MAATMERLEEYRTYNAQFCKRLYDYLCIMFTAQVRAHSPHTQFCLKPQTSMQSTLLLGDSAGLSTSGGSGGSQIKSHKDLENHLDRYGGLVLYMREMDEVTYGKLCAVRVSVLLY